MPDSVLRWGVLSTANIGRIAVNPAIRASRNGRLVAVASRDISRAQDFVDAMPAETAPGSGSANLIPPRALGSYEALLEDPDVDAVYIPLPNSLHREWTLRAVEAGKHVLCEKPLATAEECMEMDAAARAHGVKLMEAFMYRFHPRTERVVEMVREGRVGDVRVIRSAFTFRLTRPDNIRLDRRLGGGALMDVGCYCVNVSRTLLGAEPVAAQATARWTGGYLDAGPETAVDDEMTCILHFEGGVRAHFDCSLTMERCEYYEVAGTEGHLRVESAFLPGTGPVVIQEHRGRTPVQEHPLEGEDEYRLMVEHFADCALQDRPVRYPATEAAANMRAIQALYRSALNGGSAVAVAPVQRVPA
ncbi:MAG: Gfo/Idh/MocA family oxidoreductase [Gemmatimonadales bacterium]|nr:MAG: Gfo/Idh/MocA family oxidoreductase [Gemmatimonadales bacterium]